MRALASAAKELTLRVDIALVGDRPWPSRSKRCRLWECSSCRVEMSGANDSEEPPRPWMKMIGGEDAGPFVVQWSGLPLMIVKPDVPWILLVLLSIRRGQLELLKRDNVSL